MQRLIAGHSNEQEISFYPLFSSIKTDKVHTFNENKLGSRATLDFNYRWGWVGVGFFNSSRAPYITPYVTASLLAPFHTSLGNKASFPEILIFFKYSLIKSSIVMYSNPSEKSLPTDPQLIATTPVHSQYENSSFPNPLI